MARAFYRGYVQDGPRAGQVKRLHIMREDGKFPGRSALCGVHGYDVTRSLTVIIDPLPSVPPEGLWWCPTCVGQYADVVGLIDAVAFDLAGVA
ncbi:hypothetical protein Rhe02_54330 [Rhizocola hellebori]|uniref:Uncharacterized protein n=1 Tax=Rhizocola hellebori TaxID=1392758 RepID=A0A8J3QB87_9ACTN|nr:hypothetical protein [Rhizocola hellebori]GIH07366.1 hypothetical protein Rhe02_54330 [Rhizocola hellebori]